MDLLTAASQLYGSALQVGTTVTHANGSAFTDKELTAITKQAIENEACRVADKYKTLRKYPSVGDQLDALFKAGVFPADMAALIQTAKDAHPKPT